MRPLSNYDILFLVKSLYDNTISLDEFCDLSIRCSTSNLLGCEKRNVYLHQAKVLHDVLTSINKFYKLYMNNQINESDFLYDFYYRIAFYLLKSRLNKFYSFVSRIIRGNIDKISRSHSSLLNSYYLLYYNNVDIVKLDIFYLFLRYTIPSYDPVSISNFKDFYYLEISNLINYYLQTRVCKLVNLKLDYLVIDEVDLTTTRTQIFDTGYKEYYVELLCSQSDTIRRMYQNFYSIRDKVVDNDIQLLLFKYLYGSNLSNDIYSFLYIHENLDISYIKENFPQVFKLLRSIKIRSDSEVVNETEKEELKSRIFRILSKRFIKGKGKNKIILTEVVDRVSTNLVNSIVKGEYLDPLTLSEIPISSKDFIEQLAKFIQYIFIGKEAEANGYERSNSGNRG